MLCAFPLQLSGGASGGSTYLDAHEAAVGKDEEEHARKHDGRERRPPAPIFVKVTVERSLANMSERSGGEAPPAGRRLPDREGECYDFERGHLRPEDVLRANDAVFGILVQPEAHRVRFALRERDGTSSV